MNYFSTIPKCLKCKKNMEKETLYSKNKQTSITLYICKKCLETSDTRIFYIRNEKRRNN